MAGKKVKIKRVAKPKKPPGTRQKILAGLGVGSALLSAGGGQVAKSPQNSRIVSPAKTSDKKGKIKQVLTNIFGVPEAKAYGGMNSVNSSGKTVEELMINSGYNPELVNSHFMGGQGPSSSDLYNSSGLALGGGGQAASGGGSSQIGAVSGDMAQGEANAASAFAEATSGSGETPTEGNSLPSFGQGEGAGEGSGEGAEASPSGISTQGPFMEDTEPISIPITPSDNYQQMYTTPPPSTTPDIDTQVVNLPVNNNPHSENLVQVGYSQPIYSEESPTPTVAGSYTPYTTATPAPVFSNTSDANSFTDAEANTTGGQYGTYPSAASFFVDPASQEASTQANPTIVDGTAGMFGQGSGLDASGNAVFAPSSDNNWDSVWQNTTGQNPNTAISPSTAYGGGSSWEQVVLQSGGNIGDSYVVVNNEPYTRQQWESGLAPGEQGPVSPSATPESPSVNITDDAVPVEYSQATYDYLGNRTDSQQTSAASNVFTQSAEDGSYDVKNTEPPVMPEEASGSRGVFVDNSKLPGSGAAVSNTKIDVAKQLGIGAYVPKGMENYTATPDGVPIVEWNNGYAIDANGKSWRGDRLAEALGADYETVVKPLTALLDNLKNASTVVPVSSTYAVFDLSQRNGGEKINGALNDTKRESASASLRIDGKMAFISPTDDGGFMVKLGSDDQNPKYYTAEDWYKIVANNFYSGKSFDDVFSNSVGERFGSYQLKLNDGSEVTVQPKNDGTFKVGIPGSSEEVKTLNYQEFLNFIQTEKGTKYANNRSPDMLPEGFIQEFITPDGNKALVTRTGENSYTIVTNPQTDQQQKNTGLSIDEIKNLVVIPEHVYVPVNNLSESRSQNNLNQASAENKESGSASSRGINLGSTTPEVQEQSAQDFFNVPNVLNQAELNQQFQGEGAEYQQQNNSTTEQTVSSTAQDNLKSELSKYQSQKVETVPSYINPVLNTPEVPDAESSGDFGNVAAIAVQDTSAIENSDSQAAPIASQAFTPTWLKDSMPSTPAVLEDPGIITMDTQIQASDESAINTPGSDAIEKKGIVANAKGGLLKVGEALGNLTGAKTSKPVTATAVSQTATETNTVLPDKTIQVGKKSVDVYNLGTDQNPIWTDFEGNLYKASGKSMVVVGSTKYEALKDAQGQPMNLNTMSVLDISKVWSQGSNGSLDLADKSLLQNVASVTAATAKAAGNQVKNNKTVSAVGGVYTLGGVGAYGATKEVIKQVKDKTTNDYLGMIYNWAWPQDWESGGAKVVTASGQEPVLKIAGKEIPRSQVQNMTTAQLTDLVNQKINGPNKP